jgi:two-component system, LytTR family, response regulator
MILRALIIDDEAHGVRALETMLERHSSAIKVAGSTCDPELGIEMIERERPDVVFLDVCMPVKNGFQMLEQLVFKDLRIVFTTAHRDFAIQAVRSKAADYLLKPISAEDLKTCIDALLADASIRQRKKNGLIELCVRDGIIFVRPQNIIRLEASGSYTNFYLDQEVKHLASRNLKEYECLIDPDVFFRCHVSHIINLRKVDRMISSDGLFARMTDGSLAEISRKNKDVFLQKLKSAM